MIATIMDSGKPARNDSSRLIYIIRAIYQKGPENWVCRVEDVLTSHAVLKGRLSQLYQDARKIIESDSSSDADRLSAMDFAANISVALTKLSIEAPIALYLNTPKEQRGNLILKKVSSDSKAIALTPSEVAAAEEEEQQEEEGEEDDREGHER
jgi:hypothetical protein